MKSNNGPRSSFSFLPFALRFKVCGMLQDGATFAAIAADPEVVKAYAERGLKLTAPAISRIKKSREYRELAAKRAARQSAEYDDQLAAALIRESGSTDAIAETAKVALLRSLSDLSDLSDEARVKALRQVAQSVTALSSQAKDNRIEELRRKLAGCEAQAVAAEKEWKAREAELLARIAELETGRKGRAGMSEETLAEVEDKIKLL